MKSSAAMRSNFETLNGQLYLIIRIPVEPDIGKMLRLANLKISKMAEFTPREQQVARGIIRGLLNKEIAHELNLCERTIKFHVSTIMKKTGLRSRVLIANSLTQGSLGKQLPQFRTSKQASAN